MVCSLSKSLRIKVNNNYPFKVEHNIHLAPLSTFNIGGLAENYFPVTSIFELIKALNFLFQNKKSFSVFSGGSNIVFPDEGLNKLIIHIKNNRLIYQNNTIAAESGTSLASIIDFSISQGLKGLENLSGIPGSVGGAVVGNAGAYGSSISAVIKKVFIWYQGKTEYLSNQECQFAYRNSIFKHKPIIVLKVFLQLEKANKHKLKKISAEIILLRKQKYKHGLKCPGSFFKNVLISEVSVKTLSKINQSVIISGKIPAGYLLTEVGARGMKIGNIEVSDFHGNLLINNTGKGSADDVKKLSKILKQKVFQKFGILLEEEVRYL